MSDDKPALASVHGGHSIDFCGHAEGEPLEEMVKEYIARGFSWFGITEHMPPVSNEFTLDEERALGLDMAAQYERFDRYMTTCKALQKKYADAVDLYVGFECESYTGAFAATKQLIEKYRPDYIVGSVHHVHDIMIDGPPEIYAQAAQKLGSIEALYCQYFDLQLDMIETLHPAVVGHFDLIRLRDPGDYKTRLKDPEILRHIRRNLERIRELDLILDFNLAALDKGADEPYVSAPILNIALELGIALVPGDDSHGVATVGRHFATGGRILKERGFDTNWRRPVTYA